MSSEPANTTRSHVYLAAAFAVVAFCLCVMGDNRADVDLWGNTGFVKAPAWSPDYHRTNTFSFTEPDRPWVNHEWLAEYLFWLSFKAFGSTGLILLKLLLAAALAAIVYPDLRRACPSGPTRLLFLLLLVSAAGYGYSMRPHHFTFLLYVLFVRALVMCRDVDPPWRRFVLLPLFVLWANLHGAFFIGLLVAIVVAVIRTFTRKSAVADWGLVVALFACSLLNPYGLDLWSFIRESAGRFRPYLSEWSPFLPRYIPEHPDFVVLVVLVLTATIRTKQARPPAAMAVLVLSLISALAMRRNIPLFAISAAMLAPRFVNELAGPALDRLCAKLNPRLVVALLIATGTLSLAYAGFVRTREPFRVELPPGRFPEASIALLREHKVEGNMLAFFDWAEYGIWHLYPNIRQFLDGRLVSAYSRETINDYLDFVYQDGDSTNALTRHPTDIVLVHPRNPCARVLAEHPEWGLVLHGEDEALFLKASVHGQLIQRLGPPSEEPLPASASPALFP